MKLPKELTTVTPISKTLALILFITLPFISFLLGQRYEREMYQSYLPMMPTHSQITSPPPYGKVVVSGEVLSYDARPAEVDGEPILKIQTDNTSIFEIALPSGESSCALKNETTTMLQSIAVGEKVEIYGTASAENRIFVCDAEDYVKKI